MNIFVPFVKLRSETYSALPKAVFVPLTDKQLGYGNYFRERWSEKEGFINVEQDIVPTKDILNSMRDCHSPFCFASYIYPGQPNRVDVAYLGCCKISKDLIQECHDLFTDPLEWYECEGKIMEAVRGRECLHGSVLHLKIDSLWPISQINKYA